MSGLTRSQGMRLTSGCRYCIVKGKARLGLISGKKTSAVLCMDNVRSEDQQALANIVSACKANYLDKADEIRRHWGGGVRGTKSYVLVGAASTPANTCFVALRSSGSGLSSSARTRRRSMSAFERGLELRSHAFVASLESGMYEISWSTIEHQKSAVGNCAVAFELIPDW